MKEVDKFIVSEHVLEVRHEATGRFLDVRGYVADHIKGADLFPHWEIDTNIVKFRDSPTKVEKVGAFAGYQSAGVYVFDPDTRNFFEDKSIKFWKTLVKNQFYIVPDVVRFGCRSKFFLNSDKSFEDIKLSLYTKFFTSDFKSFIGAQERDLQVVVDFSVDDFDLRLVCGPIHKKEASRYFSFESDHFLDSGVYLDLDIFKTDNIKQSDISNLTKEAMKLAWNKIDSIANVVGI